MKCADQVLYYPRTVTSFEDPNGLGYMGTRHPKRKNLQKRRTKLKEKIKEPEERKTSRKKEGPFVWKNKVPSLF
jgi:hypothetical protein